LEEVVAAQEVQAEEVEQVQDVVDLSDDEGSNEEVQEEE
jgi:hypothetical protein